MIITTKAQKKEIKRDIEQNNIFGNEKVWNYLIADILSKNKSKNEYFNLFCGEELKIDSELDIWYEAEPISPKIGEGNTKLDLAFGNIKCRENTELGIEYSHSNGSTWICFVEAKFFSDCSTVVKNDPLRNQIVRVIENLLCFQSEGKFPQKLFFTLVTPKFFKENPKSRLYGYKMEEYKDINYILRDIRLSNLENRMKKGWNYPDNIEDRARRLKTNWISYEDIIGMKFDLEDLDLIKGGIEGCSEILDYIKTLADGM